MKRVPLLALGLMMAVLGAHAQTADDLNEGQRITAGAQQGEFTVSWWGKTGRTYFIQQSFDLLTWQYVPVVESGAEDVSGMNFTCTDSLQFWRLRYTDAATGGNAETADFDGDGLTNLAEVATHHSDPFEVDTDGDGLDDEQEVNTYFTDPALTDTDGDGMSDYLEVWYGLSPTSAVGADGANGDPDGDLLINLQELTVTYTDPHDADTDDDTLGDGAEYLIHGTSPTSPDTDQDGLGDAAELLLGTDPNDHDTDDDGMFDGWEVAHSLNPNSAAGDDGASGDPDDDGLPNSLEYLWDIDPWDADTDDDGLEDAEEVLVYETAPWNPDSDGDGLNDRLEVVVYLSDPWNSDTDGDTLTDGAEVFTHGTDPVKTDTDGDWMWDDWELAHGFNPVLASDAWLDADGDGLSNAAEFLFRDDGYDPHVADASGFDWQADPDHDGLTNQQELQTYLTNPLQPDTDGDGLEDGWEISVGFNPAVNNDTDGDPTNDASADPDGDGMTNSQEAQNGTNPNNADSDGDGVSDGWEEFQGTNPNDPNDSQPPPGGTVRVDVTFGDHSGSHSEKYRVVLNPIEGDGQIRQRSNRAYGQPQTDTFHLPKGAKYLVTLFHIGTNPKYRASPRPDYDYTLEFEADPGVPEASYIKLDDPQSIAGVHDESTPFYAEGKNATLYVPQIEWVTPAGDPVNAPAVSGPGQNEFTYDASSPGVLTLNLKARAKPTGAAALIAPDCVFEVPDIDGSTTAWTVSNGIGKPVAGANDELNATVTFTTLPADNSAFGKKTAKVFLNLSKEAETDYEVFFPKNATNHPHNGANNSWPNWYYYWQQTTANYGVHEWTAAGGGYCDFVLGSWRAFIGDASSARLAAWNNSDGIDTFANVCRHEDTHKSQLSAIWGSSSGRVAAEDLDGDYLKDSMEPTLDGARPYDPSNRTTYFDSYNYTPAPGDNIVDVEDYCLRHQPAWTKGAANGDDWSSPGMQHQTLNDASD